MIYKYQYLDQEDRNSIIAENVDKYLIEDATITNGNFLTFSDIKPVDNILENIGENQMVLMEVLATMYEEMLAKGTV